MLFKVVFVPFVVPHCVAAYHLLGSTELAEVSLPPDIPTQSSCSLNGGASALRTT